MKSLTVRFKNNEDYEKIVSDSLKKGMNISNYIRFNCGLTVSKYGIGIKTLLGATPGCIAKIKGHDVELKKKSVI